LLQKRIDDARLGFEVVNAGVSGDTSAGGVRRLDWVLAQNTRVLILALGANDGLRGLPVDRMKDNLDTIIRRAKARDIEVILAGMEAPPNFGPEYTSEFRSVFRDLAKTHDVVFVPFLLDRVAGQSQLNQGDGIHPNAQGAEILADTVWAALQPMLTRMRTTS
jgi:acyl-CoA thioesterase-1